MMHGLGLIGHYFVLYTSTRAVPTSAFSYFCRGLCSRTHAHAHTHMQMQTQTRMYSSPGAEDAAR
jgi:hypothetical protein